jgi:hypothetical protein
MDCTNINSIIVTIAVQMHGKIINVNLSPALKNAFDGVRLFSRAGGFNDVFSSRFTEQHILENVNKMFQKNLSTSSLDVIKRYVEYSHPIQKRILKENYETFTTEEERESVCQLYNNVTIDKIFGTNQTNSNSTWLGKICSLFEFQGIFLVSVHEKRNETDYKLLYPSEIGKNMNLLNISDFQAFARMFGAELPDLNSAPDTFALPLAEYRTRLLYIQNDKSLTDNERATIITQQNAEINSIMDAWNVHMENPEKIEAIKMSKLVKIIKTLVGPLCKLNILDYSCSSVDESVSSSFSDTNGLKPSYAVGNKTVIDATLNMDNAVWGGMQMKKTKKNITKGRKRKPVVINHKHRRKPTRKNARTRAKTRKLMR